MAARCSRQVEVVLEHCIIESHCLVWLSSRVELFGVDFLFDDFCETTFPFELLLIPAVADFVGDKTAFKIVSSGELRVEFTKNRGLLELDCIKYSLASFSAFSFSCATFFLILAFSRKSASFNCKADFTYDLSRVCRQWLHLCFLSQISHSFCRLFFVQIFWHIFRQSVRLKQLIY